MTQTTIQSKPWLKSPHLILTLDQLAKSGELDESFVTLIIENFNDAIALSGANEIGFVRDEEQSFNPRVARILLILLNDAKVRDPDILKLAVDKSALGAAYDDYFQLEAPLVLSAAFLLDRLRHLHLEQDGHVEIVYEKSLKVSELIAKDFPRLSLLLSKGVERMQRNL